MASPVLAVKAALKDVLASLYPNADTSYGEPGQVQTNDVVFAGNASVNVTQPTMGGAKRSREHEIQLDVVFSCFRWGGAEVQQDASEAALALMTQLDDYLRTRGNETLSGACRDCWVSSYELDENPDDSESGEGRRADVTATVTVYVRAT